VCLAAPYEVEIQSAVAHSQQEVVLHIGKQAWANNSSQSKN